MDAPRAKLGPFDFQFHQVAIYTPDISASVDAYRRLGYTDWSYDSAELVGVLDGRAVRTKAQMAFNYSIMPMELEFLTYFGPSRHSARAALASEPFISHMSVHVDSIDECCAQWSEYGWGEPFHTFETQNHTNPAVRGKKRFKEAIFDFRTVLGYDVKLIERLKP